MLPRGQIQEQNFLPRKIDEINIAKPSSVLKRNIPELKPSNC
jgi:hypothetical protein